MDEALDWIGHGDMTDTEDAFHSVQIQKKGCLIPSWSFHTVIENSTKCTKKCAFGKTPYLSQPQRI